MRNRSGFTLIELLIVVATLALLTLIGISTAKLQLAKGYDSRRKTDIYQIQQALEEYEKDHDCYPSQEDLDCDPGEGLKPYLSKIPCDPQTKLSYLYYPQTGKTCAKWYWVFSNLGNQGDSIIDSLGCQYGCGPDSDSATFQYYAKSPNAPDPVSLDFSPTSAPVATSTPEPTLSPLNPDGDSRFGCKYIEGTPQCIQIYWDPSISNWECNPNYSSSFCGGVNCEENLCTR